MIIDCVADLHGILPILEGGDLLIIAGDCTASDTMKQWANFFNWLGKQPYKKKILIAGNHDNFLQSSFPKTELEARDLQELQSFLVEQKEMENPDFEYLCDSGTEFEGFKIWGSPWTKTFPGMNPHCKAFTCDTEEELAEKWKMIPDDIDILVTHSPSQGVLDEVECISCGSSSLIKPMIKSGCSLHIFGHIHESYGKFYNPILGITYVNASHINEVYEPINKPVRINFKKINTYKPSTTYYFMNFMNEMTQQEFNEFIKFRPSSNKDYETGLTRDER